MSFWAMRSTAIERRNPSIASDMGFKDLFSTQAGGYAKYRPTYPRELFQYLASLAPDRSCAWDCGTGNGQAAVLLGEYFDRVWATDPSEAQLAKVVPHPKIKYKKASAEDSGLPDRSIALTTVAQAI